MIQHQKPPGDASRTPSKETGRDGTAHSSTSGANGQRIRQQAAVEKPVAQRVKRLKAEPLKIGLLRHLSLDPYAWQRVADLAESLSVESADAEQAVSSLLDEGLIVSRPGTGGTVFAISKSLSNQAFLRTLLEDVRDKRTPARRG